MPLKKFFSAIEQGDVEKVKVILGDDTNLCNAEDSNGLTAVGLAAHYGHLEVVKALLNFGADLNALSNSKLSFIPSNTALHAAIAGNAPSELLHFLLEQGADVSRIDSEGYTPLHIAAFEGNSEVASLLLQNGASPDVVGSVDNKTPVDIAKQKNHLEFITTLEAYQKKII